MRNAIILMISLVILVGSGMWQIRYINETSTFAVSDVEYIKILIENNDFDRANVHINELENTWSNMKNIWTIFIIHTEIDVIETELVDLKMYTKLKDKEESLVYAEHLIRSFNHISEKQQLGIDNVF